MQKPKVRLTSDVVPKKYSIKLKPDLEAFVFEGEETIELSLKKPTNNIALHSKELEIESAKIGEVLAEKISYDEKAETATFAFGQKIPAGDVKLHLVFRGILNDKMHGFYRSSFMHEGKQKHIATTQFESTDARRAFPCFDEPAMKAVFEVSLTVPSDKEAISNTMPTDIIEHESGWKTISFSPTPSMSTYLLAFIVGDFEHVEKKSKDGCLVRVFATPGKSKQAEFALECAAKIISFFNDYFAIPYPLPVLDLIAIPDFAAGAMENWGAITYRESALLVDPEHSSTMNKQWVALVIAHELAHQWFGNLVTMGWWTHLWLNEGFASYIEYLAVDHIFPKWDIWNQFMQSDFNAALYYDGLKHTHPIEVEVHHPSEITAVFDAVSYSKGASIIRMLADYLGEKKFRDGLRRYLKTHRYGNAETGDLWNALAHVSGKPVAKIMANWTGKAGYPLLTVSEKKNGFEIKQSRFFASAISERETRDSTTWHVPISFEHGGKKGRVLLASRAANVPNADPYFKLNVGESALFRTRYPKKVREALGLAVQSKKLQVRDRLGLVRDIFALAEPDKLSATDGLAFAANYKNETEYVVWSALASGLGKLHSLVAHEKFHGRYDAFALSIFSEIGRKIDWAKQPNDHSAALLKVLVLGNLGKYGDAKTIARAQTVFAAVSETKNKIPPDLRGIVYSLAAKHGGSREYEKLLAMYKSAILHEEKNRIGAALGSFRQQGPLGRTLAFALSGDVRPQDSVRMISSVTANPDGTEIAWAFIKKNWGIFKERYGESRELSYLLAPLEVSSSAKLASDLESFLKKNPAPGTERTVQQVLEHIRSNAAWLARDKQAIAAFLSRPRLDEKVSGR